MKKKLTTKSDLTQKFSKEMIEGKKMNYLVGGDAMIPGNNNNTT